MSAFCFFCFCSLILRGDPLSQRLLSWGPTESSQHTHIQLHTTQSPAITNNQVLLYTHCVVSGSTFFQVIQGCRAGFEPRTSHNSCSASSLKLPLSHPRTRLFQIIPFYTSKQKHPGSKLHTYHPSTHVLYSVKLVSPVTR